MFAFNYRQDKRTVFTAYIINQKAVAYYFSFYAYLTNFLLHVPCVYTPVPALCVQSHDHMYSRSLITPLSSQFCKDFFWEKHLAICWSLKKYPFPKISQNVDGILKILPSKNAKILYMHGIGVFIGICALLL